MKSIVKKILVAILSLTMIFVLSAPCFAYSFMSGGKLASRPIKVMVDINVPTEFIVEIKNAINTWNSAGKGTIFVYGGIGIVSPPNIQSGICGIYAVKRGTFAECGKTTITQDGNGTIYGAIVELNTSYNYKYSSSSALVNGYDALSVITHELGHVVGLNHSSDAEATMYKSIPLNEIKKRTLSQDDLNGMTALGY